MLQSEKEKRKWKVKLALAIGMFLFLSYLILERSAKIDVAKDLVFLHELSQVSTNESSLFDYLCKSRYWTVENQVEMNRIIAYFNKCGESNILSWCGSHSLFFVFQDEPGTNYARAHANYGNSNKPKSGHMVARDKHALHLSDITTLKIRDHKRGIPDSLRFKKTVVAYLAGLAQDISDGGIDEQLLAEQSLRVGFSSFGVGDVSIVCGDAILGGNKMRGWINPGRRGWIYAKLFDAASGKRLGEYKAYRTRQYVGFDPDTSKRFFFEIPLDIDGGGELVNARIELHSGLNGAMLFETNAILQTWVR